MEDPNLSMLLAKNPAFKKLADITDISALSKEERDKYDASIKVFRDNLAVMAAARNEGKTEEKWEIFLRMQAMGLPIETICQATGLSKEEIKNGNKA